MDDRVDKILAFWFGYEQAPDYGNFRPAWFSKDPDFDESIRKDFLQDYLKAAAGKLSDWKFQQKGNLALILLLDQFSRNIFRNDNQAYAADSIALETAKYAIEKEFDQKVSLVQRIFFYLPFEHSENLQDQNTSVMLYTKLAAADVNMKEALDYALLHHVIIERFGRFPHRNEELGRISTQEELTFLQQPNSSF